MGKPAASQSTLAPGAGHGGEGDASLQGPAQEERITPQPEQPKPTNASNSIIALRTVKSAAGETTAATHDSSGLVMTRPKPEKRKNAKGRAKERLEKRKGKTEAADVIEIAAAVPAVSGLSTARPKPERRKNAKERAKERIEKKFKVKPAEDGTTPDTTAKAKSKADLKKAERKKAKADSKAKKSAASKAA